MAESMKNYIRQTFLQLLQERPLRQIRVRDIVERCGINRNTFYYYYEDIPQLLNTILSDRADQLISSHPAVSSMEECLNDIFEFALQNRTVIMHVYQSVNRDSFEQYLWHVCDRMVKNYIDNILRGRKLHPEDYKIVISYVRRISFGLIMGWMEEGMGDDIYGYIHRICQLKSGDLEVILSRCRVAEQ